MILVYRPELENPPMDKECTLSFSFVGSGGGIPDSTQIVAGVNRDFPEAIWKKIRDYDVVKSLLSLGALRIQEEAPSDESAKAPTEKADSLADMPLVQALDLIEASFDPVQLRRWDARDARIRVKNAIAKRIQAITEGNG